MPTSTTVNSIDQFALLAKAEWEDPAITLERNLEVRAQEGPTGDSWSSLGALSPFSLSGDGSCPPGGGG